MQVMAGDDDDHDVDERRLAAPSLLGDDDLQTRVYEGGLKSWECSLDLVTLLADEPQSSIGTLDDRASGGYHQVLEVY